MAEESQFGPKVENFISRKSVPYAFFAVGLAVIGVFIVWVAQGILVPLVTGIFVSFIVMTVKQGIDRIPVIGRRLPAFISFGLSFLVIATALVFLALIVRANIGAVLEKAPEYQARLGEIAEDLSQRAEQWPLIPPEVVQGFAEVVDGIGEGITMDDEMVEISTPSEAAENFRRQALSLVRQVIGNFTAAVGGLLGALVTTFLYTAFILIERGRIIMKLHKIFPGEDGNRLVNNVMDDIGQLVRAYISIKAFIALIVAGMSFVIMKLLGTDFAGFWALLIFAFGFVPIVGAIIAITLPTLLTLVQPDGGIGKALLTVALLTAAEQSVSSFIEPRLLGRSLNLSPLVILLSLAAWGTLWGFPGMLLCVPMTVSLLIVLAQFEVSRPVAILLSDNGDVDSLRRDGA